MTHPATLMTRVWLSCIALFLVLPFHLSSRQVSLFGFLILFLFVASFVAGAFLASPVLNQRLARSEASIDFRRLDRILIPVTLLATAVLLLDLVGQGSLDLSASFVERNSRATALLTGSQEGGSMFFQIGFLLFPASYVYIVRGIAFETKPSLWSIALFGFLPPILTGLTTGGRGSLLYALIISLLALRARRRLFRQKHEARPRKQWNVLLVAVLLVAGLVSLNYFVQVFVVRVEGFGGTENAMDHAAADWGVSFEGERARLLRTVLGDGNIYLLFLFSWYIVQGLIISGEIFSFYDGPLGFGIYGIDLVTAIARRFSGGAVTDRFYSLLDLNIYGFLPSAFGSFFVDFSYGALVVVFVWGYLAGVVYRLVSKSADPRWLLAAPFVTMGILFSVLNTPLGFNNGLMTHFWLAVALLVSKRAPDKAGATSSGHALT